MSTFPLPDQTTIEAHYQQKFENGNYRQRLEYGDSYRPVYQGYIDRIKCVLEVPNLKGFKLLDIGCFTGEFLELAQDEGAEIYGLELQDEAVKIAQAKLTGRIFKADVFGTNFPQMKFGVISMLGVIEHVLDPGILLRRASELLDPGGWLMIETPNSTSWLAKVLGKFWPPYAPVEHIHLFSKRSVMYALRNLGFERINIIAHWKRLPIAYVYHMFQNFGPEFYAMCRPIYRLLPKVVTNRTLSFYGGEMIVMARKP